MTDGIISRLWKQDNLDILNIDSIPIMTSQVTFLMAVIFSCPFPLISPYAESTLPIVSDGKYLVKTQKTKVKTHTQTHKQPLSTLRPNQNGRHIAYDLFKCIFIDENNGIFNQLSPNHAIIWACYVCKVSTKEIRRYFYLGQWEETYHVYGLLSLAETLLVWSETMHRI